MITDKQLEDINRRRVQNHQAPMRRDQAERAASSAPDNSGSDFLISYLVGFPMPSPAGIAGYAMSLSAHSPASGGCSSGGYDSGSASSSSDGGSSGGGGE